MRSKRVGYARCTVGTQDQVAQRKLLLDNRVLDRDVHLDVCTTDTLLNRPKLDAAIGSCEPGDVLVVPHASRLALSTADIRTIIIRLSDAGVNLEVGEKVLNLSRQTAGLAIQVIDMVVDLERSIMRQRTRQGMAIARDAGRLKGRSPKLSKAQQVELIRLHETASFNQVELATLFGVSRTTVYRTIQRSTDATEERPAHFAA